MLFAEWNFEDPVLCAGADGALIIKYDELLVANNFSTNRGEKNWLSGSETVSVVTLLFLNSVDSHSNDDFINIQFRLVLKWLEVFKRFI